MNTMSNDEILKEMSMLIKRLNLEFLFTGALVMVLVLVREKSKNDQTKTS